MKTTIRWLPTERRPLAISTAPLARTRASVLPGEVRSLSTPAAPGELILRWLPTIVMAMTAVELVTSTF